MALLGPNGGGKTTLLNVCAGTLVPNSGEVCFEGAAVTRVSANDRARRGICTVPEGRGIFPNLTVRENLLMATQVGVPMDRIEEVAYSQFPQLSGRRRQMAGTLSGGEQQMLALARAFATDPKILLLDRLSMGLAPIVVTQLYDKVRRAGVVGTLHPARGAVRPYRAPHRRPGHGSAPGCHRPRGNSGRDGGRAGHQLSGRLTRRDRGAGRAGAKMTHVALGTHGA